MAGDIMDKVLGAAVLDAVCKTDLPEKAQVEAALLEEEKKQQAQHEEEMKKHAQSSVQFQTLDVEYK